MRSIIVVSALIVYLLVMLWIGFNAKKHTRSGSAFASGGRSFPAWLIAGMMLSEYIGSSVSIGTAQAGFLSGISAAWALFGFALGFLLFGMIMASRYKSSGHNTVSGVLCDAYGSRVRYAASALSIIALSIVTVALYAGGGAVLASAIGISRTQAILICGAVTVILVIMGGLRSVIYSNFINTLLKALGVTLALVWALKQSGGISHLQQHLPSQMLNITSVGGGQIIAWVLAGVGSIFATQYLIQAIVQTPSPKIARRACNYTFILMIPFGLALAMIGVCSAYLYPEIQSINAFPEVIAHMPAWSASIAVIGIAGAMFGAVSANTMACATLFTKDFYDVFVNTSGSEKKSLRCAQAATIVLGVAPLILAIFADQILAIAFLGKALRASLAVLIILSFYAPRFGSNTGALAGIIISVIGTIGWFLAENPFGINSTYIAFLVPLVVMTVSHLFKKRVYE
ncbi:sodium:solute symporter family protein [Carnimonas nigrificans]|uniref:sodium:solute symporter family protein n=1 Tax=Carnimonas nigrificans TaxID=64323 RepID=UPI000470390D|nr:sodium:solute symporter family protein [Carnimonas nigrificans]